MKLVVAIGVATLVVLGKTTPVWALAGGILTNIGSMETNNSYSHWWYTGQNLVLKGTATASTQVTVTIDSTANNVTADASGNWTFTPTTLTTGDHQLVIASGATSYSFTLTIGSSVPETATSGGTATSEAIPVTGGLGPTIGLVIGGLVLVLGGSYYMMTAKRYA